MQIYNAEHYSEPHLNRCNEGLMQSSTSLNLFSAFSLLSGLRSGCHFLWSASAILSMSKTIQSCQSTDPDMSCLHCLLVIGLFYCGLISFGIHIQSLVELAVSHSCDSSQQKGQRQSSQQLGFCKHRPTPSPSLLPLWWSHHCTVGSERCTRGLMRALRKGTQWSSRELSANC